MSFHAVHTSTISNSSGFLNLSFVHPLGFSPMEGPIRNRYRSQGILMTSKEDIKVKGKVEITRSNIKEVWEEGVSTLGNNVQDNTSSFSSYFFLIILIILLKISLSIYCFRSKVLFDDISKLLKLYQWLLLLKTILIMIYFIEFSS